MYQVYVVVVDGRISDFEDDIVVIDNFRFGCFDDLYVVFVYLSEGFYFCVVVVCVLVVVVVRVGDIGVGCMVLVIVFEGYFGQFGCYVFCNYGG